MKILLAEDDLRLGKILEHMLKEKEGYSVEWYTTDWKLTIMPLPLTMI